MWNTLSKAFGFFSSGPGKFIAVATIVTALISFSMWGYNNIYDAGYNEAALKYEVALSEKVVEEVQKAKSQWKVESDKALQVAKKDRIVVEKVKTIYKDVYKTEYVCEDIGSNALELLNRVFDEEGI